MMKRLNQLYKKRNKGFTLVEIVCALAVLTLVVLAFTILVTSAGKMNISAWSIKKAADQGTKDITVENKSNIKEADDTLELQIEGKGNIRIPVKKYTTDSASGEKSVHLEKLKPK